MRHSICHRRLQSVRLRVVGLSLLLLSLGSMCAIAQAAPANAETDAGELTDDPLFERPKPITPRHSRSEEEADKLLASSWFLRGRLAYQREDKEQALRYYQRAWRYDQSAVSILREIVPLAFELKHNAVAARYAVIMAETSPRDSTLLRRLAQHLMDQREFGRALSLYEESMRLREDDEKDARYVLSQMEIARLYFLEEQYAKSAAAFNIVRDALANPEKYELSDKVHTTLLGNPRVTYTLIAESFLKAKRLEQAAEMFEKALPDKASAPLLAYHLARIEMANGRPASALEQLNTYLVAKQATAGVGPYELLGEVLSKLNEDEKVASKKLRARLKELQKDDPANAYLSYFLANQLHEAGELDEAAALYEETIKAEPTISGRAALMEIYHEQSKPEELLTVLGDAVESVGTLRPFDDQTAALAADKEIVEQILKAARKHQKEAAGEPNRHQAFAAGLLAIEAEMFDAAEEQLNIADDDEERQPAVLESWGLQMFVAGEYARAAAVFQRAIDEGVAKRFDADFYYYLAAALEFDGQTEAALEAAKQAAAERPEDSRYASRYAWVLYHAKRYAEAEREYKKIIEKYDADHSDENIRDVVREARMVLSNITIHLDNMPGAEEWLLQVLDEYPEDVGSHNDLGYLWSDQGKHLKRSLRMIEFAVAAEPDNAAYRDSLGWAHFRLGHLDEAVKHLEKAAEALEETPDGVIMDHLGDAYVAAGRKQDAAAAYQRAIELFQQDADDEHMNKVQKKLDELNK